MPLVAGVDCSTQSTKVEVRDADSGELVASGSAPHPPAVPPSSEQHPDAWWSAFEAAFAGAGAPDVAAISVAGQQHGCVVTDAGGEPLRPAKLWNDTTTAPDSDWLRGRLPGGDEEWARACGSVPLAAFTITKLSWLHRSEPETWARVGHVCLPHDWLTFRLTGSWATDRGDASGTGYWSPSEGDYRFDLLGIVDDTLDWPSIVPPVLGPTDAAGEWGGVLVGPGTGDNMAAALGVGTQVGDVVVSLGTSGTIYTVSATPTADPGGAVAGFADASGRFLPLVCTLNAMGALNAVGRLLDVPNEAFDRLALEAPPGAGGLTLLPYLDGERTPNRPDATGVLAGLHSDVSRESLARAAVEGVICGVLDGLDALAAQVPVDRGRVWLVGGGARSGACRRVLADLGGRPVVTTDATETVAAGACVQAAATLTDRPPLEVRSGWVLGPELVTEPDGSVDGAALRGRYAELRDREAGR